MKNSYSNAKSAVRSRALCSLKKNLSAVREGVGAGVYGAYCTTVLGMPDDMVTEEEIKKANEDVIKLTNYMHLPEFTEKDTVKGKGEADFVAIRLIWLLFDKSGRIEDKTKEALRRFYLNDNYESVHYSENHMLLLRASRYLSACHYKGETFKQFSMTAAEARKLDHDYLISYMQYRARRGWAEFNAMGYEKHNFYSLMALHDFAEDEDIRKLAGMLMEVMLLTMFENSTEHSIYGGAHGRAYSYIVTGLKQGVYWLDALYFGLGNFEDEELDLTMNSEPYVYLSDWRPDDSLYSIRKNIKYPFTTFEKTHNHTFGYEPREFGFINKYTYNTKLYSIGCINKQDSFPASNISWYEEHQQTNWSLVFDKDDKAGITVHHPGISGLHQYWCGDQGCCCNHLFGEKNVVMGIYYIPYEYKGLLNFIHANVPKERYDEIKEEPENNRLFIRIGDAYAALTFSHKYEWGGKDPNSEIVIYDGDKTSDIRIAFACEAGDANEFGSFENFIEMVSAKEFMFNSEKLSLAYGNMHYEIIPGDDNKKEVKAENQYIDGALVNSDYEYTYNSPFMKSKFDSGVIEIYCDGKVRVFDFINMTETTRDE